MKTETKMKLGIAALYGVGSIAIGYFAIRFATTIVNAESTLKTRIASEG